MHRIIFVGLAGLAVSGCALPPVVIALSYATDGVLLATTGKTKTDHILSAGAKQDCATFRVVQGKEICHAWADGKNPYADVKDGNSSLTAGSDVGIPIYQATLDNDPFKRLEIKGGAEKIAAKPAAAPSDANASLVPAPAPSGGQDPASAAGDNKISTVPVAMIVPVPAVKSDAAGGDVLVPVSSSEVSEVIDRSVLATPPAAKNPAIIKKAPSHVSKAPAKPAPSVASAPVETRDYVVLLGSFRSQTNAQRAARMHRELKPSVAWADVQGTSYWRVSSGPYSADRANQVALRLREDGLRDATVVRESGKSNQAAAATRNGSQLATLR